MRQLIRLGSLGTQEWTKRPVAIVGGGPSLKGFDFERLRHRFTVLAVNASIFDLPWADAGFSIDRRAARHWWPRFITEVSMPLYFAVPDPWLVNFQGPPTRNMMFLRRMQGTGFTTSPRLISAGGTSGFGALHLAFLQGARRITLFGFDYGGPREAFHHNEHYYDFRHHQDFNAWGEWARNFDNAAPVLAAAGVEVINASVRSAITAFPRVTLKEALQ